jgi:hypothetical protein
MLSSVSYYLYFNEENKSGKGEEVIGSKSHTANQDQSRDSI